MTPAYPYNAVWAVRKTLPAIWATLRDIKPTLEDRGKSLFVLNLILFEYVFRTTKFMLDQLQYLNFDLVAADDVAQSVISAISEKCTEDPKASKRHVCKHSNCTNTGFTTWNKAGRNSTTPAGFCCGGPIRKTMVQDSMDGLRTHSFNPVIDKLLMKMKQHFSTKTNDVLRVVPASKPPKHLF